MNLAGWIPVVALLPPAIAAAYPLLRDRSHLSRIERVTQVIKTSDESGHPLSAGETAILMGVRQRSVKAIGVAWAIRDYRRWLSTGWWAAAWALLLMLSQLWSSLIHRVVGWSAALAWTEVAVLGVASVFAFRGYRIRKRAAAGAVDTVVGPGPMVRQDGSVVDGSYEAAAAANPAASVSSSE